MAKVTSIEPLILDANDKRQFSEVINSCEERVAEMKTEVDAYWVKIEAMELMLGGLRKSLRGGKCKD